MVSKKVYDNYTLLDKISDIYGEIRKYLDYEKESNVNNISRNSYDKAMEFLHYLVSDERNSKGIRQEFTGAIEELEYYDKEIRKLEDNDKRKISLMASINNYWNDFIVHMS